MKSFLVKIAFRVNENTSKIGVFEEELRLVLANGIIEAIARAKNLGRNIAQEYGRNWSFLGLIEVREAPQPENGALIESRTRESADNESIQSYIRYKDLYYQLIHQLN
jgi:hypothetical protein